MNILEELWYGNINPCEFDISKGGELDKILKEIIHNEKQLDNTFTDEQKQMLDTLKTSQLKFNSLTKCQVFIKGFKLGVKIMLECLDN
jgi:hypothetical protein